jgi:hypothetical protein
MYGLGPADPVAPALRAAQQNRPQERRSTPLHKCIEGFDNNEGSKLREVRHLLAEGADINAHDKNGNTPLHIAASKDHPVIAQLLIDAGASRDEKNEEGFTPLGLAGPNVAALLRSLQPEAAQPQPPAEAVGIGPGYGWWLTLGKVGLAVCAVVGVAKWLWDDPQSAVLAATSHLPTDLPTALSAASSILINTPVPAHITPASTPVVISSTTAMPSSTPSAIRATDQLPPGVEQLMRVSADEDIRKTFVLKNSMDSKRLGRAFELFLSDINRDAYARFGAHMKQHKLNYMKPLEMLEFVEFSQSQKSILKPILEKLQNLGVMFSTRKTFVEGVPFKDMKGLIEVYSIDQYSFHMLNVDEAVSMGIRSDILKEKRVSDIKDIACVFRDHVSFPVAFQFISVIDNFHSLGIGEDIPEFRPTTLDSSNFHTTPFSMYYDSKLEFVIRHTATGQTVSIQLDIENYNDPFSEYNRRAISSYSSCDRMKRVYFSQLSSESDPLMSLYTRMTSGMEFSLQNIFKEAYPIVSKDSSRSKSFSLFTRAMDKYMKDYRKIHANDEKGLFLHVVHRFKQWCLLEMDYWNVRELIKRVGPAVTHAAYVMESDRDNFFYGYTFRTALKETVGKYGWEIKDKEEPQTHKKAPKKNL